MTENTVENNLGDIVIAPEVLEVIIGITTSKIDGVYALRNKRFTDTLGKKAEGRGVYIENQEDKLVVDLYIYMDYGVSIPNVAKKIQTEVIDSVQQATDVKIDEVNIHVAGVMTEKLPKPDLEDLFDEGFFNA